MAARVRDLERLDPVRRAPEANRLPSLVAEGDDRLELRPNDRVVESVAPIAVRTLWRAAVSPGWPCRGARAKGCALTSTYERVKPSSREEALDALPGVADQRAAGDPLGRPGIGGDTEQPGRAADAPAVKDRAPVVPEQLSLGGRVSGRIGEVLGERFGRSAIELDHRGAPGSRSPAISSGNSRTEGVEQAAVERRAFYRPEVGGVVD